MITTYEFGPSDRDRARALLRALGINLAHVEFITDDRTITVRACKDTGNCLVQYSGMVVCDLQDIAFFLRGAAPVAVDSNAVIGQASDNAGEESFWTRLSGFVRDYLRSFRPRRASSHGASNSGEVRIQPPSEEHPRS